MGTSFSSVCCFAVFSITALLMIVLMYEVVLFLPVSVPQSSADSWAKGVQEESRAPSRAFGVSVNALETPRLHYVSM